MLSPHELKNEPFTKAVRGYSTTEVDEHIAFMLEKYTELYRQNDELERKLRTVMAQLDEYQNEEASIRSALVNAQKASAALISEATERADVIVRSAKTNCDKVLTELQLKVKTERDTLYRLQHMIVDFKNHIYDEYQAHIEQIEKVAPDLDENGEWNSSDEIYSRKVVDAIKTDMVSAALALEESGAKAKEEAGSGAVDSAPHQPPVTPGLREAISDRPQTPPAAGKVSDEAMAKQVGALFTAGKPSGVTTEPKPEPEPEVREEETALPDVFEPDSEMEPGFAEEEPITEEELNAAQEFAELLPPEPQEEAETPPFYDENGREYGEKESPRYDLNDPAEVGEPEPMTETQGSAADRPVYRSAGVKDTIRALNKKFAETPEAAPAASHRGERLPEEDEQSAMLRSVTAQATRRLEEKNKNHGRFRSAADEEFDRVYNHPHGKR